LLTSKLHHIFTAYYKIGNTTCWLC